MRKLRGKLLVISSWLLGKKGDNSRTRFEHEGRKEREEWERRLNPPSSVGLGAYRRSSTRCMSDLRSLFTTVEISERLLKAML